MKIDRGIGVTVKKELKTALRDRRTLFSTIILPILLPFLMFLPAVFASKKTKKLKENPTKVVLLGQELLPGIEDSLKVYANVKFFVGDELEKLVKEERADVGLEIKRSTGDTLTWTIVLYYDPLRMESRVGYEKIRSALLLFSSSLTERRLKKIGVESKYIKPIVLEEKSVASPEEMGGEMAGMFIALLIIIGSFSGGMPIAIDATAGEKERKTLETLLAAPVSRNSLVFGKFLAALTVSFLSVLLTIISVSIVGTYVSRFFPLSEFSFSISMDTQTFLILLLMTVLTISFIVALEIAVGIFARTYREAQSYLTPLTILIILPVVFLQLLPPRPSNTTMLIPILNTIYVIKEGIKGNLPIDYAKIAVASSLIYAYIALKWAFRMFRSERAILR